jgi:hypothetical protein
MVKRFLKFFAGSLIFLLLVPWISFPGVHAQILDSIYEEEGVSTDSGPILDSIKEESGGGLNIDEFTSQTGTPDYPARPEDAGTPAECGHQTVSGPSSKGKFITPENCLFLEEPIGGRTGYDLYVIKCFKDVARAQKIEEGCTYTLWHGEAIQPPAYGPVQAILTREKGNADSAGVFLFYGYLGLIYRYASGVIVGMVVLFIIVGGIQMTTSAGDTAKFDEGKKRIVRALVGMVIWFLASLILYTINPTFFVF